LYNLEYALIELTNRCNLGCLICGSDSKNVSDPNELSIAEWMAIVDELRDLGVKRIVLSGGEPTLKDGIGGLIDYINASGIEYAIITNGFIFPENVLEAVKQYPPFTIGISIDGNPQTHDWFRGKKGSFSALLKTIHILKENAIPISVNTTVHKGNYRQLPWIAEFLRDNRIYGWQIQLAMPFGRMRKNQQLILSQREFEWVCSFVSQIRKTLQDIKIEAADDFSYAPAGTIRDDDWAGCSAGICSVGIDAHGNVKGCLSLTECPPEGNLRKQKLSEIWNDRNKFSYNRNFCMDDLSGDCLICEKATICRGGCGSQSYSMIGKYHQSPFCFWKTVGEKREIVPLKRKKRKNIFSRVLKYGPIIPGIGLGEPSTLADPSVIDELIKNRTDEKK